MPDLEAPTLESNLEKAFRSLLRGTAEEFDAHLNSLEPSTSLAGTKAVLHCHHVHLDGNGIPKTRALLDALVTRLADYAIPRIDIERAREKDAATNSTAAVGELHKRAVRLFVQSAGAGEVGELLLYCLIQAKLRVPQLLCKMSLKTNQNVHYHGADGIHATIDAGTNQLAFYWGESKLHKDIGDAISECLATILPFLYEPPGQGAGPNGRPRRERDLELVRSDLSKLGNEELEAALLKFLDPNHPDFNKVNFRGACLIGFDCDKYPKVANTTTASMLADAVRTELQEQWRQKVSTRITSRSPLETFHLEVFLVPLPDVDAFKAAFIEALRS